MTEAVVIRSKKVKLYH